MDSQLAPQRSDEIWREGGTKDREVGVEGRPEVTKEIISTSPLITDNPSNTNNFKLISIA